MTDTTVVPPARRFRTIRGSNVGYKTSYYRTQAARDVAAQRDADQDRQRVITELWDKDHPQDELNRGWGCDGVAEPSPKEDK